MRNWRRMIAGGALLGAALAGCSFQAALDKMVPRERQDEIVALARDFCTDPAAVLPALHSGLAGSVQNAAPKLPGECPGRGATWRLASYEWGADVADGASRRREDAVVVGTSKGKWTTVTLRFYAESDAPMRIVAWNVLGSTTKPEALSFAESYDDMARLMAIALPATLLLLAALAGWLIWRWRKAR